MSNKNYMGQYQLVDRGGRVCGVYETLQALMLALENHLGRCCFFHDEVGDVPGREHYAYDYVLGVTVRCGFTGPRYHVRELESGCIVSVKALREAYAAAHPRKSRWVTIPLIKGQPVPGTGKGRGGCGYYRHMRTLQILKVLQVVDREEPPVRAKVRHAPTAWDDVRRSDRYNNSWKRYRKTQYKTKS